MGNKRNRKKISIISTVHYAKLVCRSIFFLGAVSLYVFNKLRKGDMTLLGLGQGAYFLLAVWICFAIEMLFRFFPSKTESMGCEKQFKKNYLQREMFCEEDVAEITHVHRENSWKTTLPVILSWILLNGAIGLLYYFKIIDAGILVLISLFYSVCDMICILFFCPFQTWMMKNKCCGSCRIYNWDYAMMFTPFIFTNDFFTKALLGMSLVLLLKWEFLFNTHTERFIEETNCSLSCINCNEKLCHHKKQLRGFLKEHQHLLRPANIPLNTSHIVEAAKNEINEIKMKERKHR